MIRWLVALLDVSLRLLVQLQGNTLLKERGAASWSGRAGRNGASGQTSLQCCCRSFYWLQASMSTSVASRSVRLLLLLIVWGVLDVGSSSNSSSTPAAETSTAQNLNQEMTSSSGISYLGISTSAARSITQAPNLPFKKYNLTMKDFPQGSVFKTIILQSPVELELLCSLVLQPSMDVEQIEVVWKKENEIIKNDTIYKNESKNSWCSRHEVNVTTKDQLGNYTCVYKTKPEINSTFHLQVPEPHGKSGRIISYVGDFVVLSCLVGSETKHYNPSSWVWYTKNGSEQVAINTTLMPEKYTIIQEHANVTKLKIMALSEEDTGVYSCEAMFPLGARKDEVSLKVLTYMTPLKPFLAIAAEVVLFVAVIFAYEACTKKKEFQVEEVEKEFEQTETLKTEDSNGVENSTTRQRKV